MGQTEITVSTTKLSSYTALYWRLDNLIDILEKADFSFVPAHDLKAIDAEIALAREDMAKARGEA